MKTQYILSGFPDNTIIPISKYWYLSTDQCLNWRKVTQFNILCESGSHLSSWSSCAGTPSTCTRWSASSTASATPTTSSPPLRATSARAAPAASGRTAVCLQIKWLQWSICNVIRLYARHASAELSPAPLPGWGGGHGSYDGHDGNSAPTHAHQRQPASPASRWVSSHTASLIFMTIWGPALYILSLNLIRYFFSLSSFVKKYFIQITLHKICK